MNGLMNNFYEVLDVSCNADVETINQQFLNLSKQTTCLHEKIQIYQAYRVLGNPLKRSQYDKSLLMGLLTNSSHESLAAKNKTQAPPRHSSQLLPAQHTYPLSDQSAQSKPLPPKHPLNQREYHRLPFERLVLVNEKIAASTLNISPKGLQIQLTENIDDFRIINLQSKQFNGLAKICFIAGDGPNGITAGLSFLKVKFNPQLIIDEYI